MEIQAIEPANLAPQIALPAQVSMAALNVAHGPTTRRFRFNRMTLMVSDLLITMARLLWYPRISQTPRPLSTLRVSVCRHVLPIQSTTQLSEPAPCVQASVWPAATSPQIAPPVMPHLEVFLLLLTLRLLHLQFKAAVSLSVRMDSSQIITYANRVIQVAQYALNSTTAQIAQWTTQVHSCITSLTISAS